MVIGDEPLGTKNKFWCECAGERWLFKEIRKISDSEFSGEDWSEKVAAEIARVLGIPAARVELSVCSGRRGCVSKNFTSADQQLVHGNEVLAAYVSANYEQSKNYGQAGHTLESIFAALGAIFPETGQRRKAMRQFADYCVLDALIGNVDRHHENWGVLWQVVRTGDLDASEMNREHDIAGQYQLAPSYDHASSLGRELTDKKRGGLLKSGQVSAYVRRGHGGIFLAECAKGANPLELVAAAVRRYPDVFWPSLDRLRRTPLSALQRLTDEVPDERMSLPARCFAKEMLGITHKALTEIEP